MAGLRLAALLLVAAVPAAAQAPAAVEPGGVATLVVTLEPAAGEVRYVLHPAEGVRPFVPVSGRAAAPAGEPIRLPLTFGVPARAAAGRFRVSELALEWEDGRQEVRELEVEVLPRHGAGFWLDRDSLTADLGSAAEVGYRVRNEGNVTDTFHVRLAAPFWLVPSGDTLVVLGPGEQESGLLRATLPAAAVAGQAHVLRLVLTAREVREPRSARVTIVTPESAFGGLATVPATIFVGSTTGDGSAVPGVAFSAAGDVRPGIQLTMDLRHADESSPAQVFRGALSGPRLRVGLAGDQWAVRAGDVFSYPELLMGPGHHGRGMEAAVERGDWDAGVFLARPWSYPGDPEDGHILGASARYESDHGTFGVRASSVHRNQPLLGVHRQAGAVLTYGLRRGGHQLDAEAGLMRVGADSASELGLAGEVRYALNQGRVSVAARLRRVPATSARTESHGNEAFVSSSYALTEALALTGSAYATDAPRVDLASHAASRGAGLGLRLDLPDGFSAGLLAGYRSNHFGSPGLPGRATRTVTVSADVPLGAFVLEADADLGATEGPAGSWGHASTRLGARWDGAGEWAWLGLSRHAAGGTSDRMLLDVAGSARFRSAEVQAGLNAPLIGRNRLSGTSFWSGVTMPIVDRTSLSMGAEYRGSSSSPWRFSIGLRRSFGVPLPVTRRPVLEGVLFEDLDGDGVRRSDEPTLAGIGVSLGPVRATTDEEGRFRFYDATGARLRIDPADLPLGVSLAHGAPLPGRGRAEIGVVRTASVDLRVFLDRDGDGIRNASEAFAVGAIASVVDGTGAARDVPTDAVGRARFNGLMPGNYRVLVRRSNGRAGAPAVEIDLVLHPGSTERVLVALPLRSREIRLPDGAPLERSFSGTALTEAAAPDSAPASAGEGASARVTAPSPARRPVAPQPTRTVTASVGPVKVGEIAADAHEATVSATVGATVSARGGAETLWGLLVAAILLMPGLVAVGLGHARGPGAPGPIDQRAASVYRSTIPGSSSRPGAFSQR